MESIQDLSREELEKREAMTQFIVPALLKISMFAYDFMEMDFSKPHTQNEKKVFDSIMYDIILLSDQLNGTRNDILAKELLSGRSKTFPERFSQVLTYLGNLDKEPSKHYLFQ